MDDTELRERVAALLSEAMAGEVTVADALAGGSLVALGVDSLGLLRLVDAIELEYGIEIELPGNRPPDSLDDLVTLLAATRTAERPAAAQD